jgi:uncharacterized coiled-coil protein SlyX
MANKADRIVHSVSFPTQIHKVIEECAKREGDREGKTVTFGRFINQAVMFYLENSEIHAEVLDSINPNDREGAQATFVDSIKRLEESVGSTVVRMDEHIDKRFEALETRLAYQEKMLSWVIYMIVYHLPEIPSDRKKEAAMSAMERLNKAIAAINKEFAQAQAKKASLAEKEADGNA